MTEPSAIGLIDVLLKQREAWRKGNRIQVEEILQAYPNLGDDDSLLDLICSEIVLRQNIGDNPTCSEYIQRFPSLKDQLLLQFEVENQLVREAFLQSGSRIRGIQSTTSTLPQLDGCEILGELGRGAMGVVFRGWQTAAKRPVAVKQLYEDVPVGRVRSEAAAAARLHHPNIVTLFDVKEYNGRVALVLEYVEGGNLSQKLAGKPIPPVMAARLVETLALAMSYAHTRGVIHRDLKPSNILLAGGYHCSLDQCVPKISDFGLAKLIDQQAFDGKLTRTNDLVGTPSYMSPEQADGRKEVDQSCDVYALGCILYECLTGRPPFLGDSVLATLEQVRNLEPLPPSRLQPSIPRDLEIITLKCLQKLPNKRYSDAQELARDLNCWIQGRGIKARPVGLFERLAKWCLRQPMIAALLLLCVFTLVTIIGLIVSITRLLSSQRDQAVHQAELLDGQLSYTQSLLYTAQLLRIGTIWQTDPLQALQLLENESICPPDLRCLSWDLLRGQCRRFRKDYSDFTESVTALTFSEQNKLFIGGEDGQVKLFHRASGYILKIWKSTKAIAALAYNKKSRILAIGERNGDVILVETETYQSAGKLDVQGGAVSIAWHPDGKTLAVVARSDGGQARVSVWDIREKRLRRTFRGAVSELAGVSICPDGRTIASANREGRIHLWEVSTGKLISTLKGHDSPVRALIFPDSGRLITGGLDSTVRLWDVDRLTEILHVEVATGPVTTMALHPDGNWLAIGGEGPVDKPGDECISDLQFWEIDTRKLQDPLRSHRRGVLALGYRPDGVELASGGVDQTVKIWNHPLPRDRMQVRGHTGRVDTTTIASNAAMIAWMSRGDRPDSGGQEIHLHHLDNDRFLGVLRGQGRIFYALSLNSDGQYLAAVAAHPQESPEILIWETKTNRLVHALSGHREEFAALNLNYPFLITVSRKGIVRKWNISDGTLVSQLESSCDPVLAFAFNRTGEWLALGTGVSNRPGRIVIMNTARGEIVGQLTLRGGVQVIAIHDDQLLAYGSDNRLQLASAKWKLGNELSLGIGPLTSLAFCAEGRSLVAGGGFSGVKIWDIPSRQERATLPGHRGGVCFVGLTANNKQLVSISRTAVARIWHRYQPAD